ncbi:MAG: LacI family DNA-binding transcriptional regulator [Humibacter sp.]
MAKAVTMREVAAAARVSTATVSHFINGTKALTPATTERIQLAIEELNYVPNRLVRTLRGKHHSTVGLVVPDLSNPFFSELASVIEDALQADGYLVVLCDTRGEVQRENDYLRRLAEMRVAGVIGDFAGRTDVDLSALEAVGSPLVLLGSTHTDSISSVTVDSAAAGLLAAHHLLSLGHERVAFLSAPGGEQITDARWQALRGVFEDMNVDEKGLVHLKATGRRAADHAMLLDELLALDPRPTAVVGANDYLALTVLHLLLRRGVEVPVDMSVMGFDDIPAASLAYIALTTVKAPAEEMGKAAVRLLLRAIRHEISCPEHSELSWQLITRESTAAPRPLGVT